MKKSIFLFFAAILCAMSVSANMVYLKPGNWLNDGADVWVHSWGGTQGDVAGVLKPVGLGLYGLDIKNNTNCLFVRQSGGQSGINWDSNWYKTGDLTIESGKECYHVSGWDVKGWIAVPSAHIAGDEGLLGVNWAPGEAANKMTKQDDGTYTLVKTVTLEAPTYFFKVTDGTWDWSLGDPNASNNDKNAELTISEAGEYNVTFTYNPTANTVSAVAEKVEAEEPETPAVGEIAGEFTFEISNLEVTDYGDFGVMGFAGSGMDNDNNFNLIVNLFLDTNNQNDDGSFNLASADIAPSTLTLEGIGDLTIAETYIEATLATLEAIILATLDGQTYYKFNISMSKGGSATSTIDIIQEATMTVNDWGMLVLTSEWTNDADGITYPISVEIAGFINTTSYTYSAATITIGGQGDTDPWLGFGESTSVIVTIEDGELAIEGTFTGTIGTANVYMWASFNVPNETLYFVNTDSWSEVSAYAWYPNPDGGNYNENGWPGATLNKTNKTIYGKDVYEFTYPAGSYQFVIFNGKVNNETKQTADLACTPGQYFVYNFDPEITSNCWRKETYLKQFYVVGTHNEWNVNDYKNRIVVDDNNEASKTLTLAAGTHELKVTAGSWTFAWGYDNLKNKEGVTTNNDGNIVITLQKETDVTIAFNSSTLEITLSGLTTEEPEIPVEPTEDVYTIKGADGLGLNWTVEDHADDMTKQAGGHYTLEKTELLLSASATYDYKVIKNGSWDWSIPSGSANQTVTVDKDGKYDIVFTLSADLTTLTYAATLKEEVKVLPSIAMHGNFTGSWSDTDNFTASDDATKATLTLSNISAGSYSFGMRIGGSTNWTANSNVALSRTNNSAEIISGGGNCSFVADATGDYTFTWTYATNTLTVTYPAETGEEIQYTYTVVGPEAMFGTNWDPSNTANDMTKQEDGTYTKTIENVTLAAEAPNEYKIVRDHSWDWKELSGDANLTFSVDKSGIYNLTFVLNADATEASVTTSLLEETDVVLDAYVAGNEALTGSNFSLEEKNKMTYDSETKTYSHTLTGLKASTYYELKVVHGSSWLGYDKLSTVPQGVTEGNSQNICFQLASDGNLVVTYNATTGITLNGNFYVFDGSNQPSTLYFRPNTAWKSDNARFAAYFFGTTETWVDMTDANGDGIYEVANDKTNANVIFCRMNPSTAENKWDNNLWNQTIDIQIPNTTDNLNTVWASWKNVYKESDEDAKLYGTWVVPETIGSGDNTAFYNKYNGKTINVIVERTFTTDVLHTLCLPFSLPANWIGTAYQLSGVQSNTAEELVLYVKECNTFEAGKPYIVEPTNEELASKEYLLVDNVTISTSLTPNSVSNQTHVVTLNGILNGSGQTDGAKEYYIGTDGALHKEVTNKLALRSIVEITDKSGNPVGVRARVAFNENVETGVEDIIATDAPVKTIVNGQLIIIREGVKYNVQGQVIR